jgi:hypothetical protein
MYEAMGEPEAIVNDYQSRALELYKEVVESGRLSVYGASLEELNFDKVVSVWAR